jgi:hypothetical protein
MKKRKNTLVTRMLSGFAALVMSSTFGGKEPLSSTAVASPRSAEAPGPTGEAAHAHDRSATRGTPAAPASPFAPTTRSNASRSVPATKTKPKTNGFAMGSFRDLTGPTFALSRVTCQIDGRTVYSGPGGKSLRLFQGELPPGRHTVTVQADYRIKNAGPFFYTKGFQFKVLSGRRFDVGAGRPVQVSVVGYERGGPTRDYDERLALAIDAG